jgi:DNA-binding CsgD family transcriptional regulator
LACSTAIGWRAGISNAQRVLGQVRAAQGDHSAAKALLEASLATYRELRARGSALTLARLSELAVELGDLGAARQWLAESVSLAHDLSERTGIARGLEGSAHLAAVQAQPSLTLRLAAAAAAIRTETGARLPPRERFVLDQRIALARTAVGKAAAAREWAEGAALSPDDAVACALTMLRADSDEVASGQDHPHSLTSRERQVALLVARGLSNPQIAGELVIGERTAQTHVGNILSKLGLSTRAQIAVWVTEHHLAIGNP